MRTIISCINTGYQYFLCCFVSIAGAQSQKYTTDSLVYTNSIILLEQEKAFADPHTQMRYLDSLLIFYYYKEARYKQVANLSWKYLNQQNAYYFHAMHQAATYMESTLSYADSALLCSKDTAWQLVFSAGAYETSPYKAKRAKALILLSGLIIPGFGFAVQNNNKRAIISLALTGGLCFGGLLIAITHAPWYAMVVVAPWLIRYHIGSSLQARNLYQDRIHSELMIEKKRNLADISILPKY